MFIIVGLGNPGNKYQFTRHNIGFLTIDYLAEKFDIKVNKIKHRALLGEGLINGEKVILVKPQTYMNLSGESLLNVINWYKVDIQRVIVIYDDIDIEFGNLRIRPKGSAGSHNGMRSIIYNVQTDDFPRIRMGIGKLPERWELADYVLQSFGNDEVETLKKVIQRSCGAIETIISKGVPAAMNEFNRNQVGEV